MDEAITVLLIQWATCSHRIGKHRAVVVAKLIQKRQSKLRDQVWVPDNSYKKYLQGNWQHFHP